jgi:ketosteroid isomerase-like protein
MILIPVKKLFLCILVTLASINMLAQDSLVCTHKLVSEFHAAWNKNDLETMVNLLQPDAFFKSPHQLRYGRDEMASTVLLANPPFIKDCWTEEWYSYMENDIAWSIGRLYCNTYNDSGEIVMKGTEKSTEYTYVFSRDQGGNWKIQMLLYHE